jgi:hypothetical protein
MEIIFELFFELLLQLVGEVSIEALIHRLSGRGTRKTVNAIISLIVYFGLGVMAGFLSLLIFPQSFVRSSRLHGISLIIIPLLAGLTMVGIGRLRRSRGQAVMRLDTFGYGFVFAFGMALMRFLFTT